LITLLGLLLVSQPILASGSTPDVSGSLTELFRLSDEYRQCLLLDKTSAAAPQDTYFAEGGTSSENLDLLLADREDHLLKELIKQGRGPEILKALAQVEYRQVNEDQCYDFDPYFGPALEQLMALEKMAGVQTQSGRKRTRHQRPR
jgi:hypothetical protein